MLEPSKAEKRRTPLDGLEDSGFQRLGEPGMHSLCLLLFAFKRLEVVKAALPCDLTLELLEPVK